MSSVTHQFFTIEFFVILRACFVHMWSEEINESNIASVSFLLKLFNVTNEILLENNRSTIGLRDFLALVWIIQEYCYSYGSNRSRYGFWFIATFSLSGFRSIQIFSIWDCVLMFRRWWKFFFKLHIEVKSNLLLLFAVEFLY